MKYVLVVEDEPSIRELVAEALRESGYVVDTAAHGAAALQLMRDRKPDAIVLDMMMPRLDGISFVKLMRMNPRFAHVPIGLAAAAYGAAATAERIGARACLTKPFELDDLVDTVGMLVGESLARPTAAMP